MAHFHDWFGDASLYVLDVPLACCALESQEAAAERPRTTPPADARLAVVLSGTITHAVAPAVRQLIDSLPGRPAVLAFGTCAATGGPYWDSYAVVKGAEELGIRIDQFIAGCPPPPEALTRALEEVRRG
ncbi:proton-conducting membrane transporter [Arachnia propionica]|uniref:Proton-conducting membrane transporter n=1 Tax=Arachnia propionica TaxID=1750 RepID=A0A3P1T9B8_9ACTN|nr:proton-conducting membrane transporter [Arachnia propionica]MDO5082776.1 proton-conducting membrane transporter [Arachnia propionica]RRD05959.1 proton-conducting membrane transporter [Arachnia propionica]